MTATRYWRSPDGKRTVDLDAVVETYDGSGDPCKHPKDVTRRVDYTLSAIADTGRYLLGDEGDSFLDALDAWRAREDTYERAPYLTGYEDSDGRTVVEPAKPAIELHGWREEP